MNKTAKITYGVFGLGLSGLATIAFLSDKNISFIAWDDNELNVKKAKDKIANHDMLCDIQDKKWTQINCLILSPGIPLYFPEPHPIVKLARQHNIEIICDIELFYRFFPNHIYIGITGTNGKSTTTALIGHILKENNIPCKVVGNIGTPILSILPDQNDFIVVEVSSYQLDLIKTVRFNAAILLNITKDHIDRHGSLENYTTTKYGIFATQKKQDVAVINIDYHPSSEMLEKLLSSIKSKLITITTHQKSKHGISIYNNILYKDGNKVSPIPQPEALLGTHNQENISAAYAAISNVTTLNEHQILDSVKTFQGLAHRIQIIGKVEHMQFVNDSKATNFESTENALKVFEHIYWIAGGLAKEGGIENIATFKNKIIKAFLVGSAKHEFAKTLDKHSIPYNISDSLDKAFPQAVTEAQQNHLNCTILLSPAAASLDQWKNFEERGNAFITLATQYINAHK